MYRLIYAISLVTLLLDQLSVDTPTVTLEADSDPRQCPGAWPAFEKGGGDRGKSGVYKASAAENFRKIGIKFTVLISFIKITVLISFF